jgi:hypothetical protein
VNQSQLMGIIYSTMRGDWRRLGQWGQSVTTVTLDQDKGNTVYAILLAECARLSNRDADRPIIKSTSYSEVVSV